MSTWRKMITEAMSEHGDTWGDVVACTLSDEQLDITFDSGHGGTEGESFTVWTVTRVYFPACYDGSEWCASVARVPDGHPTAHVGGG